MKSLGYRLIRRTAIAGVVALIVLGGLWLMIPRCELYREDLTWSPVLRDRNGEVLHLALAADDRYRIRVPLEQVSPTMIAATLAFEDEHYFSHIGVNPLSLVRALFGRIQGVSRGGGSTITMQYARLRFGLSTRTISGKFQQMLRAWQLEKYYTKEQILEAYLNVAPYGGNVEGVAAASRLWCGIDCRNLGSAESVALVMLPQRPALRRPRAGKEEREGTIAARMRLLDKLGIKNQSLSEYRWEIPPVPRSVPHLARRLRVQNGNATIDADTQKTVEETVHDYLLRVEEKGVSNAAVLLIHAPTREVRSYVASADFFDSKICGQVDVIRAKRSPGSLYKPFLYGVAIERGLVHPQSMLADAPMRFRDYNPENYERDFLGPVMAGEALYRSRNLPAISLMSRLSDHGLYDYLKWGGVSFSHDPHHYGMSLALGAAAATPEEIGMLYASLADDGIPRRLVYQTGMPEVSLRKMPELSAGSRWLVKSMLVDPTIHNPHDQPAIAMKTGTSQGFRDAWAVGMSGDTVIVVWVGNSDATANPAFEGRAVAAPLMEEIFRRTGAMEPLPLPPESVQKVDLCAVSGMIPCEHCRHRKRAHVLAGVSPIMPCDLHRLVWVDQRTGLRVAPRDDDPQVRSEIIEFWPPEFLELFRLAGLPRRAVPESAEVLAQSDEAPRILTPMRDHVYQISSGSDQGLICRARAAAGVTRLFWFANGVFLGSCSPSESFIWHEASGSCNIHVMDDRGLSTSVQITAERSQQ